MSGEAKVLTREEERDLRKWAKSAGGCGCNLRWHRLFVTLDAERSRAAAAEAERDEIAGVVAQLPVWLPRRNEAWREAAASVAMKLDENVAQIVNLMHERDAAEADAAALRGALKEVWNDVRDEYIDSFQASVDAALAPGAGTRVAAVVEAARALRQWEAGAEERGASPRPMFDDSHEIEWDRRLDALCAAVSALDGEGARDGK